MPPGVAIGDVRGTVLLRRIVLTLAAIGFGAHSSASEHATIRVLADAETTPVNRLVLGHNVEAADSQGIFTTDSNTVPGRTGDGVWDPRIPPGEPVDETVRVARDIGMSVLRYPGGCLTHGYDWKAAVGPLDERPDFTFGLDEFIAYCWAVGAEPLITVSAYVGGPAEAGELVEYLNAPATPDNPWAMLRADCGHPQPYGVRYFEMGNESDHGNHDLQPRQRHTPHEYVSWFNACVAEMRAVDPEIQIGAHLGTGTGPWDPWNAIVLDGTRDTVDFIVVHTYVVGFDGSFDVPADLLMRATMAAGDRLEELLADYRTVIVRYAGRSKPLAVTEYNAAFVQEEPVPYRFSLGAGLFAADYVRVLLDPAPEVLMANYWHFVNGYWGMLQGPRVPGEPPEDWTEMAAVPLYRLWGSRFGDRLVPVEVNGPRIEFEGYEDIPRSTDPSLPGGSVTPEWQPSASGGGWSFTRDGQGDFDIQLDGVTHDAYLHVARIDVLPGRMYTVRFEARSTGDVPDEADLGLALFDPRGWEATHSAAVRYGLQHLASWTFSRFSLSVRDDADELDLYAVLSNPDDTLFTAGLQVRDLKVVLEPTEDPYPALTAVAALDGAGERLHLIVFNKHHADAVSADVEVEDLPLRRGRVWSVTGPALEATNLEMIRVRETVSGAPVALSGRTGFQHTFPPHSMTAFELLSWTPRRSGDRTGARHNNLTMLHKSN